MYHAGAAAALLFNFIFPAKLPQGELLKLYSGFQARPRLHVYFAMLRLLYLWTVFIDYYVFLVMEGQPGKSQ